MPLSHEDNVSIENGLAALATGLNKGDISSLDRLMSETCVIVAPFTAIAKGERVREVLRNMALGNDDIQLRSDGLEEIADGAVRDIGTLSLRRRRAPEERIASRYVILWQKTGASWQLSTMVWNRGVQKRKDAAPSKDSPNAEVRALYAGN